MFKRLFVDHPQSVGESYAEHLAVASRFGWKMIWGGFACLIHGLVPGLFKSTGSRAIACLHDEMVLHRRRACAEVAAAGSPEPARALQTQS